MKTTTNLRTSCLAILALSLGTSLASAQSTWSYDFNVGLLGGTAPSGWVHNDSASFNGLKTPAAYGMKHAGDPGAYGMTMFYPAGVNGTSTLSDGNTSYDLANGLRMTMGWSPSPSGLLTDDGFSADNELMQLGLVGNTSTSALLGLDPSVFLSIIEDTASTATNVTNSFLAARSETGVLGYFNGGSTYAFEANNYYVFEIDLELYNGTPGVVNMGLKMDIYNELVQYSADYTLVGTVDFGVIQKLEVPIALDDTLYPAMGFTLRNAGVVSISGANFDTMSAIPEPSSVAMLLLTVTAAMGIRRRR